MKIVHLAYSVNPRRNDPEVWLKYIGFFTGSLEAMSGYCEVININFINYTGSVKKNGVAHYFFNVGKVQRLCPVKVHAFVKKLVPDIIVIHGIVSPWQVLLLRFQLHERVRIVSQHHAEKPLRGIKGYLQAWADRHISAYFFSSVGLAMPWIEQKQIASASKIHEVMEVSSVFHPIDKAEAIQHTSAEGAKIYLWVGRLNQNKDPLTLIDGFIGFIKDVNDATLYIIFQTDELLSELQSLLARDPRYAKQIRLVGKVNHEDLIYWYNSSTFMISTSHHEGSGVAVCEAMSCGCIPVLTDIPSFRMMTGEGNCGLLFMPGDAKALTTALRKSLSINVAEERQKVLKQFRNTLSFEAIAKKTYDVLSAL